MPIDELIYFILIVTIITLVNLIRSNNPIIIALLSSAFSVFTVVFYLILDAPDVAMTEASVGIIAFILFVIAISIVGDGGQKIFKKYNPFLIIFCILLASFLIYCARDMTVFGFPNFNQHYLKESGKEIGIPSVVASILASYRGFDTLLETLVIVTGMVAISVIINSSVSSQAKEDQMLRVMTRIFTPIILLFAAYIQAHGEISPGGGFQAGAILATAFIIYSLIYGNNFFRDYLNEKLIIHIAAFGVLAYLGIGLIGFYDNLQFLNYNGLLGQKLSITIIELAVGISVGASFLGIYLRVKNDKSL